MNNIKWNTINKGLHNYSHCVIKLKNGKYDIAWIGEIGWENAKGKQYKDNEILGWIFEELASEKLLERVNEYN